MQYACTVPLIDGLRLLVVFHYKLAESLTRSFLCKVCEHVSVALKLAMRFLFFLAYAKFCLRHSFSGLMRLICKVCEHVSVALKLAMRFLFFLAYAKFCLRHSFSGLMRLIFSYTLSFSLGWKDMVTTFTHGHNVHTVLNCGHIVVGGMLTQNPQSHTSPMTK